MPATRKRRRGADAEVKAEESGGRTKRGRGAAAKDEDDTAKRVTRRGRSAGPAAEESPAPAPASTTKAKPMSRAARAKARAAEQKKEEERRRKQKDADAEEIMSLNPWGVCEGQHISANPTASGRVRHFVKGCRTRILQWVVSPANSELPSNWNLRL